MASGGARRVAGDQECRGQGDAAGLPARRPSSPVPDRYAGREPSRRAVVAIRVSDAGSARRCQTLRPRLSQPDRKASGRWSPRHPGRARKTLSVAADQGGCRCRPSAEERDPDAARTGGAATRPLRDGALGDARESAAGGGGQGLRPQPYRHSRCPLEAAPGVLRSAPRQTRGRARRPICWRCCRR